MADGGRSERLMAEKSPICLQSSETLSSYHHLSDEHWEVYGGIFLNKLYHYFVSGNMFAKSSLVVVVIVYNTFLVVLKENC